LAVGLLQFQEEIRKWAVLEAVIRAVIGAIVAIEITGSWLFGGVQLCFGVSIGVLLLGRPAKRRILLACAIFTVGYAVGLWIVMQMLFQETIR
jgi:hypothetical protein